MNVRNSVHTAVSYQSNRTTDSVRTQVWAKPLPNKTVAVVMLNRDGVALVTDLPASCNGCGPCNADHPVDAPCTDNATASVGAQSVTLQFAMLPVEWLLLPGDDGDGNMECEIFDIFATPKAGRSRHGAEPIRGPPAAARLEVFAAERLQGGGCGDADQE